MHNRHGQHRRAGGPHIERGRGHDTVDGQNPA